MELNIPEIPYSLPYVGHLFYLGNKPYDKFLQWSFKYGSIFSIKLGFETIVIINGTDNIREALIENSIEFAGRPNLFMLNYTLKRKGLISASFNNSFKEHRKFLLKFLEKYLKTDFEFNCLDKIQKFLKTFQNKTEKNNNFSIKKSLTQIVGENIITLIFGADEYDKNSLFYVLNLISKNFQNSAVLTALNLFPFTRILYIHILKNINKCVLYLNKLINDRVKNKYENINFESDINNSLINRYLDILFSENNTLKYKSFSSDQLNSLVQDIFVAGTETLANSLNWALIYAAQHQEMQNKIYNEIQNIIGTEKLPSKTDQMHFCYGEAFLEETLRYHCAGPILLPRATTTNIIFNNYHIPANTFVLFNMWSCVTDCQYWERPEIFNPDRFLDENGKFISTHPAMMPFGAGKRKCPGEKIARLQLFLIFISLIQKFHFSIDQNINKSLLTGKFGIGLSVPDIQFIVKIR